MKTAQFEWGEIPANKNTGRPIAYVEGDVRDYARFLEPHPAQRRQYPERDWNSVGVSRHVRHVVHDRADAQRVMAEWKFPVRVRANAERHAHDLANAFAKVSRWTRETDLRSGRLDRRKLAKLGRELERPGGNPNTVNPYWRMSSTPVEPPTLYIVASAGWRQMWQDDEYIPSVVELALSVAWAAEAAGLRVVVALTQDNCALSTASRFSAAVFAHIAYRSGDVFSLRNFAVMLHRDLWRHGYMCATASSPDFCEKAERLLAVRERAFSERTIGHQWFAVSGGRGVAWARHKGADIVIGIGDLADASDADIRLAANFNTQDAVRQVCAQAAALSNV